MKEKGLGFSRFVDWIASGGKDIKEGAKVGGCAEVTANRWKAQLKHRVTVFEQRPKFDENGRFVGWVKIRKPL